MTTWGEPTDIHVDHEGELYMVRHVTSGYRVWRWQREPYDWVDVRPGGKLFKLIVEKALEEGKA